MVDHLWHFVRERSLEAYYVDAKWSILGKWMRGLVKKPPNFGRDPRDNCAWSETKLGTRINWFFRGLVYLNLVVDEGVDR